MAASLGRVCCFLPLLSGAACASQQGSIDLAVLPFRPLKAGLDDVREAAETLVRVLESGKGGAFRLVPPPRIEDALAGRRIRVVETFSAETAGYLSSTLDDAALLSGTVLMTREDQDPAAAVLVRLFNSSGHRLGSHLWTGRAEGLSNVFGLGAPEDLGPLFDRWAIDLKSWITDRLEDPPVRSAKRIAVIPFTSDPEVPESGHLAGLVTAHILEEEFHVEVVEPGDLYEGLRRARIRTVGLIGVENATRLAREVGARWLITGAVLDFRYGRGESDPPVLAAVLRLFDASLGRTVASTIVSRTGDQGEIVLGHGLTPHPIDNLLVALREGIERMEDQWEGP